ncbi:hypothetical protein AGMMS50239_01400 [Bacteroidia bacterium]|nr:hypothetical protein AGMMS50239_01400 [Bacteroidia bacterium]
MITVLADDITGAAEIAGIGLRFGWKVAFDFAFNLEAKIEQVPSADVWIIASDTRSMPEKSAVDTVQKIAVFLKENHITRIYKKIDSALRGHIIAETNALLDILAYKQALILPANPEMGRIIRDGIYYINDIPLNETAFADDPDFPATSATVSEILNVETGHAPSLPSSQPEKFMTPDCISVDDFNQYVQKIDTETLPMGGSAFFETVLQSQTTLDATRRDVARRVSTNAIAAIGNVTMLMICGSTHENSKKFIRDTQAFDIIEIPQHELEQWSAKDIFADKKRVLITVKNDVKNPVSPEKVKRSLARITKEIVENNSIEELFIEGGATAYACLQACGISSLVPVEEYSRGVVRMEIPDREKLHITIKPGSYLWPEKLFLS